MVAPAPFRCCRWCLVLQQCQTAGVDRAVDESCKNLVNLRLHVIGDSALGVVVRSKAGRTEEVATGEGAEIGRASCRERVYVLV